MKNTKYKIQNTKLILMFFTFLSFNFLLAATASAQISSGGSFNLEKSVLAAGGGESAGIGFTVTGTSGQNAAGTTTQNSDFSLIGGFWTADQFAPTSALVSISGKVTTLHGNGIRNVIVTLSDLNGSVRTTVTGSFGIYSFTDVEVGNTYFLKIQAKRYFFANTVRVVTVNEELTNIDFTADD